MQLVLSGNNTVVAIADGIKWVRTQPNGYTVLCAQVEAEAAYDSGTDTFYRFRSAYPGDTVHHVVEVETVPDGITPGRWRYAGGEFIAVETVDERTMTQLAVAELAQAQEDNNTATQLAIAELAEAVLGGST